MTPPATSTALDNITTFEHIELGRDIAPKHVQDMFTSLTSASKPHHMMSGTGVILGYSHFGMLAAARWVMQQTQERLREAMEGSPGYRLQIVGHSLGAGTAALLTTRQAPVQTRSHKSLCLSHSAVTFAVAGCFVL